MNRRIIHVLAVAVFASMIGFGIVAPLLPDRTREFGGSGMWIAIIGVAFSASRGVFMPLVGKISDRSGRKRFIVAGLLFYSLFSLAYLPAHTLSSLLIVRIIHGIGSAMVIPIAMAYIGETTEKGKEGSSMAALNVSLYMGLGCGPLLGGLLYDHFGFSSAFYAMAVLSGIAFVVVLAYLPASTDSHGKEKEEPVAFSTIIRDDTMKGTLLIRAVNAMLFAGTIWFLPVFAEDILQASATQTGTVLSAYIFLTGLVQIPLGSVADRHNKLMLVLVGSLILTFSMLAAGETRSFGLLLLMASIMGLGSALLLPAASAVAVVKMGEKKGMGTQMGLLNLAMSIGMVAGPLIVGPVSDAWGVEYVFPVLGVISLVGTLGFVYWSRRELRSGELKLL